VSEALLMEDASDVLVPPGDEQLSVETHLALIDGMAALAARMWGLDRHGRPHSTALAPASERKAAVLARQVSPRR